MDSLDWPTICSVLISIIIVLPFVIYKYLENVFTYWTKKGIPQVNPPSYIYGHTKDYFYGREFSGYTHQRIYNQLKGHPYGGYYEFINPVLMIKNPELIQTILVEKFQNFHDGKLHQMKVTDELVSKNPFFQTGAKWKETRSLISPGFTPARLKVLDEIVKSVYGDLSNYIDKNQNTDVQVLELSHKYTCDVAAAWGWGVKGEAFSGNSPIKNIFDKFKITSFSNLTKNLKALWPQIGNILENSFLERELKESLIHFTDQVIKNTDTSKSYTFLQLLLSARDKYKNSEKETSFTTKDITGHMVTYYLEAYESSGSLLNIVLYQLMLHPEVQQKLREEVLKVTDVTLESVNKLVYMDMVISEAARLFAIASHIGRVCTEKCRVGSIDIDTGTLILIPNFSIHRDPEYYPNPNVFNPENFSEENKKKRHKYTYLPFGYGPRGCLGMKYATSKIKMLLCYLLKDYEILPPKNNAAEQLTAVPRGDLFIPQQITYSQFKKIK